MCLCTALHERGGHELVPLARKNHDPLLAELGSPSQDAWGILSRLAKG
jgi:hypothetical protein